MTKIPDAELYAPNYSPWRAVWFQDLYSKISPHTVVSLQRCWTLWQGVSQALNAPGDVAEAGVFQGGTAKLLREALGDRIGRQLYLFDSFEGMKSVSSTKDRHAEGDFADTSVEAVQQVVGIEPFIHFRKGWVPETFQGLEDRKFCFAHIDLDLYDGVLESLKFFYPRMSPGGVIVFDDYGFASCPGARRAVDEFFADKPERLLVLSTGQGLVHKL
ncbi:MAG: TylF/MycF/NovP-related O-methyltransferase [Caulobacteraceae bacterium]